VKEAVFSPDGKYVATTSDDSTARVWDTASSSEFVQMVHADEHAFPISRDGTYLATAGWDRTARVWDPASGEEGARMAHRANVMPIERIESLCPLRFRLPLGHGVHALEVLR
jgi:WD40 repeat protein